RMAEDLVDLVSKKLEGEYGVMIRARCKTDRVPLAEASFAAYSLVNELARQYPQLELPVLERVARTYGPDSAV
ncbi:MAG: hypothetical protein GWN58_19855, partial [Anaerolineae bacterium]|nr:hypothetical protein [Anaerolineae bacterium]